MKAERNSSPAAWTREIKDRLCRLGQSQGFKVGTSGCISASPDWGEWLYDMTWFEVHEDRIVRLPMILESEWIFGGVEDDFYKLVQARADLRVLIFENKYSRIASKLEELKSRLSDFRQAEAGDRYLFAANNWDQTGFVFESYAIPQKYVEKQAGKRK